MCTVSFVNHNNKIIITSNRDEKIIRPSAIPPKNYLINDKNIFFPKDKKANGTWFAADETGSIIVLLNGALEKHIQKNTYKKSRGLILLDLISSKSILNNWSEIDLENIEPFTLVVFENNELYQLQWNELEKSTIHLDKFEKHIWSSSTLYSSEIRKVRKQWFVDFIAKNEILSEDKMIDFHSNTESENKEFGLQINRGNLMKTVSISQAIIQKNKICFQYNDLISNEKFNNSFIII